MNNQKFSDRYIIAYTNKGIKKMKKVYRLLYFILSGDISSHKIRPRSFFLSFFSPNLASKKICFNFSPPPQLGSNDFSAPLLGKTLRLTSKHIIHGLRKS